MSELLTTRELADYFKVTTQTIWRWRDKGMPHIKLNSQNIRYDLVKVNKWIELQNK
jgi:predicted DNA-binding transcriptional regulator AlpA